MNLATIATALARLVAAAAQAQTASTPAVQCDYQGALARPGDRYLSTRLTVPMNGRCSHSVGGASGNVQIVSPPRSGRVDTAGGTVTYTPNQGFAGADEYVFRSQYGGIGPQVTVSVTVR